MAPSAPSPSAPLPPAKPGMGNTYLVRRYKSGKTAYARLDRASRLSSKGVADDRTVALSAAEASWMWRRWPAESPERPETREARIGFLLANPYRREFMMEAGPLDLARGGGASPGQDDDPGGYFTWWVWRAQSGALAVYNAMDDGFDRRMVPARASRFDFSPEDGQQVWDAFASWGPGMITERAVWLLRNAGTDEDMDAAELPQDGAEERILAYLVEHDEIDARAGLPDDLADIGAAAVLDFCEGTARETGLYGSRRLMQFGLTDEARKRLGADFPEQAVRRCLARGRSIYAYSPDADEAAADLGIEARMLLNVLAYLADRGDAEKMGMRYQRAAADPGQRTEITI